jgi:hypothetical protein
VTAAAIWTGSTYPVFSLLPGMAVGADGALTGGENRLPPVGLIDFSVGEGGGAGADVVSLVVVVVVGGVVVSGAFSPCPQAESTPMAMIAPMPAVAARRRVPNLMMRPICVRELNYIVQKTNSSTRKARIR